MKISLDKIGRRFNREWIFRNISCEFESNCSYAILGANGTGKSTLLQIISGSLSSSEGAIKYFHSDKEIHQENIFTYLSLAAPYLELIEEFTLSELIDFHFKFKNYRKGLDKQGLIEFLGLKSSEFKAIKNFSSGMKQRVKLALAFGSDTEIILLDEPTSNLDKQGFDWYLDLVSEFSSDRLLIVCSNQEHEYHFCTSRLIVTDFK